MLSLICLKSFLSSRSCSSLFLLSNRFSNLISNQNYQIQQRCFKSTLAQAWYNLSSRLNSNLTYFKRDKMDPKESMLIYRADSQKKIIWFCAYLGPIAFFGSILLLYNIIFHDTPIAFDDNSLLNYDPSDRLRHIPSIIFVTIFNIISLIVSIISQKFILRIYYLPKKQHFVIVLENFLIIQRPRKFVCFPGEFKENNVNILGKVMNYGILNGKVYVFNPESFAIPIFYNILCGYNQPSSLTIFDHNLDTEKIFRQKILQLRNKR